MIPLEAHENGDRPRENATFMGDFRVRVASIRENIKSAIEPPSVLTGAELALRLTSPRSTTSTETHLPKNKAIDKEAKKIFTDTSTSDTLIGVEATVTTEEGKTTETDTSDTFTNKEEKNSTETSDTVQCVTAFDAIAASHKDKFANSNNASKKWDVVRKSFSDHRITSKTDVIPAWKQIVQHYLTEAVDSIPAYM
jgi:hypothetical protein